MHTVGEKGVYVTLQGPRTVAPCSHGQPSLPFSSTAPPQYTLMFVGSLQQQYLWQIPLPADAVRDPKYVVAPGLLTMPNTVPSTHASSLHFSALLDLERG